MLAADSPAYDLTGATRNGVFSIERLELSFAGGATSASVPRGRSVQPKAVIKFVGQGNLKAVWLLDKRVIDQVNLNLHSGSVLSLTPPPVSTEALDLGNHVVELKIEEPGISFAAPLIRFFVSIED